MKTGIRDQGSGISSNPAEETLRLLARLSAPEGLEERVQKSLRVATVPAAHMARILSWPALLCSDGNWMQGAPMRAVAAVVIVTVVVGGGWVVSSRLPAAQPGVAITTAPHGIMPGGFSSAGARRTPQTLDRPLVTAPAEAPLEKGAPQTKEKADQPLTQTPFHRGKLAAAKKLPSETATHATK
jgi:hypothetical protein